MKRRPLLAGTLASIATASCRWTATPKPAATPATAAPDPLLAEPGRGIWPAAFRAAPPPVQEAYAYAVGHARALGSIPCYCGCTGEGHRSNYDCYVREERSMGWVLLDPHGFG